MRGKYRLQLDTQYCQAPRITVPIPFSAFHYTFTLIGQLVIKSCWSQGKGPLFSLISYSSWSKLFSCPFLSTGFWGSLLGGLILMCLLTTVAGTTINRINYGVIFKEKGRIHFARDTICWRYSSAETGSPAPSLMRTHKTSGKSTVKKYRIL